MVELGTLPAKSHSFLTIVGGGLAGCEAAWQAARRGIRVRLYEMRPILTTGAHRTSALAELICSNSLGSNLPDRAQGLLKTELRRLGSLLLDCADQSAVPAGGALAVDRETFSLRVTRAIETHPLIEVIRAELTEVPVGPCIMASGPLTSPSLSRDLARLTGSAHLYFYDALAPIVESDSIDRSIAFSASRYGTGQVEDGDYINCPLNAAEYKNFVENLLGAERIPLREFEQDVSKGVKAGASHFFEGCLPVEIIAGRGEKSLAFGPMTPMGLRDPRTGRRPYAVVQLRQDNMAGTLYNLVGFQTNLTWPEQKRVLRLIPGLERAEFARYGQMHRNTFINSPVLLHATMQSQLRPDLYFAGQITGVEGYAGNMASGLVAGVNAARQLLGQSLVSFPVTTMIGALCWYVTHADPRTFQPMKAAFGLLPPLTDPPKGKRERGRMMVDRAAGDLERVIADSELNSVES